jgi:hypothetical protein
MEIKNYIIPVLMKFEAKTGQAPTLVLGSQTVEDFMRYEYFPYTYELDGSRHYALIFFGFEVEVTEDFEYGFYIK